MSIARVAAAAALSALVTLGACDDGGTTGGLGQPCSVPGDCILGLQCVSGTCRDETPPDDYRLDFEVDPPAALLVRPSGLSVTRQQFVQRSILGEVILRLSESSTVTFDSTQQVDVDVHRVGAVIPGRSFVRRLRVFPLAAGRPDLSRARLVPGFYDLLVRPAEDLPASTVRSVQVASGPQTIPVTTEERVRVAGTVVQSTQQDTPIAGVRVVARGVQTGQASSVDVTDETGRFSILLPRTDDVTFDLTAIPPTARQPAWSFAQRFAAPEDDLEGLIAPLELPTEEERRCVGVCVFGNSQRVPRALVTFEATDTRAETVTFAFEGRGYRSRSPGADVLEGCVERAVFGDVEGTVTSTSLPMMAGTYRVRVRPPSQRQPGDPPVDLSDYGLNPDDPTPDGLPYAVTETTLEVPRADGIVTPGRDPCRTDPAEALQIEVDRRKLVIGRLVSEGRVPRRPAFLSFHRVDCEAAPLDGPAPGPVVTRPGANGDFAVFLEAGCHAWVAKPTGADRGVIPVAVGSIVVNPVGTGGSFTQRLGPPLTIPEGIVFQGRVRLPQVEGAPSSRVRAFARVGGAAFEVARATTDADGFFLMRVPIRLGP